MSGWADKPTIDSGSYPTSAQLEEIISQLDTVTGSGWIDYTPTWTGQVSDPSLGNGSVGARYRTVGDLTFYEGVLIMGSTTTYGSGTWYLSVPSTATSASQQRSCGAGSILDSGTQTRICTTRLFSTVKIEFNTASGSVTATSPQTWATNDELRWSIFYEAA